MKNVLLLHPRMLFYKIRVYNALRDALQVEGYNLVIWCCDIQVCDEPLRFVVINGPMTPGRLNGVLDELKPCCVMSILFGASTFFFNIYALLASKMSRIPIVYYGHGFDLRSTGKKWKMILQNLLHMAYDGILLYSDREKSLLWAVNRPKVFVANNTLVLTGYEAFNGISKAEFLRKYKIAQDKVVLFCGRIQERKRLDLLVDFFSRNSGSLGDTALVIVGQGLTESLKSAIAGHDNIYYLGPIFDSAVLNEVFYMSTVFCIPGQVGLGLVEAMYWGLPVLTLNDDHGPEIGYLVNGYNGFQVEGIDELGALLLKILSNPELHDTLSGNARSTILEQASLAKMFCGFTDVLNSVCR